ncbi:DinG family ATP-dependent helicase YpvA [Lachnospiraceae bacterium KM106-2]|nr:DinG family ATP-dependent helicase YpvA [Lachnospiraceae bacterium KM106-2]
MCARLKEPFEYKTKEEFQTNLVEWIGDVLYDILPEHGYEIRDEQIFTAFQIADAFGKKEVHLAEAGLGTGKTFAYLLSAIPYARFRKKPVVIACATSALQEQLASEEGDINKLSKVLGLEIDARMAKDPHQYICDVKVEDHMGDFGEMSKEINDWLGKTKLGERSEMPMISDQVWKHIGWDESMGCEVCSNRGYCKLMKAKESYRDTVDLIIVDHETFFHDLWTREERIADGKVPILPSYAAVILDEGHKIMLPAAMQAGDQIDKEEFDAMITSIEEVQGARDSLVSAMVSLEQASNAFFATLDQSVRKQRRSNRQSVRLNPSLFKAADELRKLLDQLLLEMQIEQELYFESIPATLIQAYEGQLERAIRGLARFTRNRAKDMIVWVDSRDDSLWVVPRNLTEMMNQYLYKQDIPIIYTSATLSNEGDFSYFARTIGLKKISKSTVGSPFDIENQVTVTLVPGVKRENDGMEQLLSLLEKNGGRALVLTNSLEEVERIREGIGEREFPFEMLWEDKGDRGYLVKRFREEETSVLVGADFWEGIDVPGDALTLVVIWQLPFPALDPLAEVQRAEAKEQGLDPVKTVDYPEMGLKLKQGCGRLIRTEEDHGEIVILDKVVGTPWEKVVMGSLPEGAHIKKTESF